MPDKHMATRTSETHTRYGSVIESWAHQLAPSVSSFSSQTRRATSQTLQGMRAGPIGTTGIGAHLPWMTRYPGLSPSTLTALVGTQTSPTTLPAAPSHQLHRRRQLNSIPPA